MWPPTTYQRKRGTRLHWPNHDYVTASDCFNSHDDGQTWSTFAKKRAANEKQQIVKDPKTGQYVVRVIA